MIYVSIDIETTGLNFEKDQILEIGAVAQELGGKQLGVFRAAIWHERISGSPIALDLNRDLLAEIAENEDSGTHQGLFWALDRFRDFLNRFSDGEGRVVAAGKNFSSFDRIFLERDLNRTGLATVSPFHPRTLDPTILYLRPEDTVPPNLAECIHRAKKLNDSIYQAHQALSDALAVRDLIEHYFWILEGSS